ncbi:glycosyltransferase [Weissella paramesenteroides]|uniref:bifunctional glycosyltransferase/CDP-glycerol:glycerophosphate glycerophosphotransferase n=1 Tax=Weissella paramesenteroides TaxID=1249 RepID=UPI00123BD014|nr:CDP-glycerol glycerophosphotransferase family protein [Weissella paramesenteroides]KAA8442509.1 glycosyltransferase [Weissella paramesenteroides]KAA8442856.1 glycosyltransferase [Weissella paramesenteroides]KAA8444469.1 glycosyltransferase [Weissella paramesenteroides]KAA8448136.1 glycosyltransferase [Weissella paramesenteroides]KAA8452052.1 glycosyltransferase [Weissella paramesenteroides]
MEIISFSDKFMTVREDGFIWVRSVVNDENYYCIGGTKNKKLLFDDIDICFDTNKLEKGKYCYFYSKSIDSVREKLDTNEKISIIHSKGTRYQKSFFKPKNGRFITFYPNIVEYKYKFSIIMAVYNVEKFIEDSILSVLRQTEKSFQLILVNDGTPDSSGQIAKEYSEEYTNIVYLEEENKGVSAARNLGMSVAEGEFWNFMDPDDVISENTLEEVYKFFKPRKHITDVVAIPIKFFGDKTGDHPLNKKFQRGKRIINLLSANQSDIDLSLSASFVRREAIENLYLDTSLKISEDLLLLNTILLDKLTLGVVDGVTYNYRRVNNFGAISKTQSEMNFDDTKQRFLVYERIIKESIRKYGSVIRFIQQVVLYDLSWQLKSEQLINDSKLSQHEKKLLRDKYIFDLIGKYIDSQLIFESKRIAYYTKQMLIHRHFEKLQVPAIKNHFGVWQAGYKIAAIEDVKPLLISVSEFNNNISIVFQLNYSSLFLEFYPNFKIMLDINGNKINPSVIENNDMNIFKVLDNNITRSNILRFNISKNQTNLFNEPIKVVLLSGDLTTQIRIRFNKHEFSSLGGDIVVDSISENYVTKIVDSNLQISKKGLPEKIKLLDEAFGEDSEKKQKFLSQKLNKHKPIWLFEDRPNMAGDNAESMFKYVINNHPEIDAYFVLEKNSNDWSRLSNIGPTLDKFSPQHMNVWSIADIIISAHAEYQVFNPISRGVGEDSHNYYKTLRILNKPKFVFLQHGISRSTHHLNRWLNLTNKNIGLFIVSTIYELNEFKSEGYHYGDEVVKQLGMPRLDDLLKSKVRPKNKIIFMPTWRKKFADLTNEQFMETNYFNEINSFFHDRRLLKALKKYNYTIAFKIHPNLSKYSELFDLPKHIYISMESYTELYKESKIAITDFSSAVLDFAYIKRPIIQYKFDENSYFNGHTFNKKIGDNEAAIYGNIYSSNQYNYFITELINKMINPIMDEKYAKRINQDFALRDGKNHERVFKSILELAKD